MLIDKIQKLPLGFSVVEYNNKKYGVTRTDYNSGKSSKVYAEELGGVDFISLNIYITNKKENLKPCEMPEQRVIHFLNNFKSIKSHKP